MMYSCIKNGFLVADDTLIQYEGTCEDVVIPEEIEPGHPILHIGDCAFYHNTLIQSVSLPDSLRMIGSASFQGCSELRQMSLPFRLRNIMGNAFKNCSALKDGEIRLRMTEGEFFDLIDNSRLDAVSGGLCPSDLSLNDKLIRAFDLFPALKLPMDIPMLFFLEKDVYHPRMNQPLRCLRFDGKSGNIMEDTGVRALITAQSFRNGTHRQERQSDYYLRTETWPAYAQLTIPLFSNTLHYENEKNEHAFSMRMELLTGYFFWQSVQRICYRGTFYYLYRRNYLTNSTENDFDRQDMAVYSNEGIVTDVNLAEEIYAKYRLLAIL